MEVGLRAAEEELRRRRDSRGYDHPVVPSRGPCGSEPNRDTLPLDSRYRIRFPLEWEVTWGSPGARPFCWYCSLLA
jgi:hypothetical protein